jgi:uncharacterized membrane protein (DUF441 family)
MRLKAALIALGIVFLLITGFLPNTLPYFRTEETRYSDAVIAHWPNALYMRESLLERNTFPLWRETLMAGQPFAANPLNKTAYPLQWLVLLLPPAPHLQFLIVIHLFLAAAGMWCWAQSLGLSQAAVILTTIAYTLAPRMITHLAAGHLDIVYALGWFPWLMWATQRFVVQSDHRIYAVRLALVAALLMLADVRVALFALGTACTYGLLIWSRTRTRIHMVNGVLVGGLFVVLVTALLVPLIAWQPFINRGSLTAESAGAISLEPGNLFALLLPANQSDVEKQVYLGLSVLLLAWIGMCSFSGFLKKFAWHGLFVGIVIYALGVNTPIWPQLVSWMPFLAWFRVPSRIWLVAALLIPVLAGYGLDYVLLRINRLHKNDDTLPKPVLLRLLCAGWIALVLLILAFALVTDPDSDAALPIILVGGGTGVILILGLYQRLSNVVFATLVIGLMGFDLMWSGYHWLAWRGPDYWMTPHMALAERLQADNAQRVFSPSYSLEQQVAEQYQLQLFGGIDPFQLRGVTEAVGDATGIPTTDYQVIVPPLVTTDTEAPYSINSLRLDFDRLQAWQVSHVVTAYPLQIPQLELLDTLNNVYIYRNTVFVPGTTVASIPRWPPDQPDLPNEQQIITLNQITLLSYFISALGWIGVLFGLIVTLRQTKHG